MGNIREDIKLARIYWDEENESAMDFVAKIMAGDPEYFRNKDRQISLLEDILMLVSDKYKELKIKEKNNGTEKINQS